MLVGMVDVVFSVLAQPNQLLGQNSDPSLSGKRNTDFVSSVVKFEKAKKGTIGDFQKSTIIQTTPAYVESEQGPVKKNRDQLEQK